MLQRILRSLKSSADATPSGAVPDGARVYAVGDIHGRLDLLDELLALIEADDGDRPSANTIVIFLGDLVDRGPESAQVVQRLLELSQRSSQARFLLGNHEEVFLKAFAGEKGAMSFFLRIGGKATLASYGIAAADYRDIDNAALTELLRARVPQAHIDFLSRFEDLIEIGDYAFVHAGIRPGVPLARQVPSTLRWIRDEFINHRGPMDRIIVHGHTISEEIEERQWRIGIDTGAFASGKLTAMCFEGHRRWILQTNRTDTVS